MTTIAGARLPGRPADSLWDLSVADGRISSIRPHRDDDSHGAASSIKPQPCVAVFPALAHAHVHLDKAFLNLSPEYADLLPRDGSFAEALATSTRAKARFSTADVLRRGRMLLDESCGHGVTAMRAFVDVDVGIGVVGLEAAGQLKREWASRCHVQIVCFAQDALFSGPHGDANRRLMEEAVQRADVDVVGTTPYVESDDAAARRNIEWAVRTALRTGKHLDFHLDYNLDSDKQPTIWHVLDTLRAQDWPSKTDRRVVVGHATRLCLFSRAEWQRLAALVARGSLPISFAALPTSDVYMAAAAGVGAAGQPRGTLPVCRMVREHGLDAVVAINNVANALTPWGGCDPLALASLCVGLQQAGSAADAELLFACVSTRARAAMGLEAPSATLSEGDVAELLVVGDMRSGRAAVTDLVWSPSTARERSVVCSAAASTTDAGHTGSSGL